MNELEDFQDALMKFEEFECNPEKSCKECLFDVPELGACMAERMRRRIKARFEGKTEERPKVTNLDRVRHMPANKLARMLNCKACAYEVDSKGDTSYCGATVCAGAIEEWLLREAE